MGKLQIIKFEQNRCNASVNDNSVLFVRVCDAVSDRDARFEVPFTHNAYVIKGGGDGRLYGSGTYDVFDDRGEYKDMKRGGSVDIIYMPKDTNVVIRWGTPERVKYRDAQSGRVVGVAAYGQFGIMISNPEQFFRKVVGARKEFDLEDFSTRFSAAVVSEFADSFLRVVEREGLTYDRFDANRKKIGEAVGELLSSKFRTTWGIDLSEFIIEHIGISQDDIIAVEGIAAERARKAQAQERERLERAEAEERKKREDAERKEREEQERAYAERKEDRAWEREKFLEQLKVQDNANYYSAMSAVAAAKLGADKVEKVEKKVLHCEKCGAEYVDGDKYCHKCGARLCAVPCKNCGKINGVAAEFCSNCGEKL